MIPLVDLSRQNAQIAPEIGRRFEEVIESGFFVLSDEVEAFEKQYARFVDARHCVGVANGTDALELCFRALGLTAEDEVLLPANSFAASAHAVLRAGARVRFCDVDPGTFLIDPASAASQVTERTRVVLPVHLFGQLAPMEELVELAETHGLRIVEDAAQAHGADRNGRPPGALSVAAATSFYPSKNLGAFGDAGAVTTDDQLIADDIRALRHHGSSSNGATGLGFNSRLDALQAVVLSLKLEHLDAWNAERAKLAAQYEDLLSEIGGVGLPVVAPGNRHVWHLYVVRVPDRDAVIERLRADGIGAQIHYSPPIHLRAHFRTLGHARGDFPVVEAAADEIVSLPLFPGMTASEQEQVADSLRRAVS